MRLLVVSDVHGNLPALEAVLAEPYDRLLCLGDIVGYGPFPGSCLRRLRAAGATMVQGNHDRALADGVPAGCRPAFQWLADATAGLARAQLDQEEIRYLGSLPRSIRMEIAGGRFLFVHATPRDPLYRYLGPDPDLWQEEVAQADADVVVAGHTHLQFMLHLRGTRVANPGSAGQPKDGDPQAAYAVIEDGRITLKRIAYPIEETIAGLEQSALPNAAGPVLAGLLRTGRDGFIRGHETASPAER